MSKLTIDWQQSPPFITANSGNDKYAVVVTVHSMEELHAAHDLVLAAFRRAIDGEVARRVADAQQA